MADPPFSARNRGAHRQIDSAFPPTARNGLLHVLFDLLEREYVAGWPRIARELQRIGRLVPVEYDSSKTSSVAQAKADAEAALVALSWDETYDFCERLHNHLACEVGYRWDDDFRVTTTKSEVQKNINVYRAFLFALFYLML